MCGIFGIVGSSDAANITFNGLADIEYRGYDSWGVSYWDKEKFVTEKNIGFLPKDKHFPASSMAIGHTRWATHGGVTIANAHPHSDCTGKLVLVHNGIVENYLELKNELSGHKIISETDTEIVVHLIENELKNTTDFKEAVLIVFRKLKGLNAIVVSDGSKIVAAKKGSPLVVGDASGKYLISSDPNALLPHTRKFYFLEDNEMVVLGDGIKLFNVEQVGQVDDVNFIEVDWEHTTSTTGDFPHFMLKEIHEQPNVLKKIKDNFKDTEKAAENIKNAYGTFLIGCGTASYACLAGVYLFSKIAKKHVNFSVGSEFTYTEDFLTDKSLLLAISQSGESIDVVEPVGLAKKKGAKIASLVNVLGSTLYRMSDQPVLLNAGIEKGVASTKAMIAMIAHLIIIAHSLNGKTEEALEILEKSHLEIEDILNRQELIKELSEKISSARNIFVLGRGLSYPTALETALKIKEISYIHAEGFASGELKHGVIALIEDKTPVIVFVPNDETKEAALSNAMEVKSRGAFVIGVGVENNPAFDFFFEVKDCGASSILPHIVFAQLLAYYLSTKLGYNPDKPRNLAKSVVVR